MERRLAAILIADVADYSRMVGADEAGTHDALRSCQREVVEPLIAEYRGHAVNLTDNDLLVEFASAVDAVHCARAIQQATAERNEGVPEARRIRLRIGINVGDIIIDGEDIYGTGVNVAARLKELADPGGTFVSEPVADYVKSLADLSFQYVGRRRVKNISSPVVVYRVQPADGPAGKGRSGWRGLPAGWRMGLAAGLAAVVLLAGGLAAWFLRLEQPAGLLLPDAPSVAVLPFDNFGPDRGEDYLANGITEDLIISLAKFPDFFVIARNTSFTYKDRPVDVQRIGRELGVRYVVEGSIQRSGDIVRVTALLSDALSGRQLWSDRYDQPLEGLFQVQDSVTAAIAGTMMGTAGVIADAEIARLSGKDPSNFGAYDYLMRGWEEWYKLTPEGNREARRLFETARDLDPGYARAYAGIAWTHALDYEYDWTQDYDVSVEQAMQLALKAVQLDDRDYKSYWILGWAHLYKWEHDLALANYNRARELNPNDAELMAEMASLLIYVGHPQQAIEQLKEAMRRNPLHDAWYLEYLGWAYEEAGMPQQCIETLKLVIDPVPTAEQLWLLRLIAACYAHPQVNRMADAEAAAAEILRLDPDFSMAAHKAYVEEVFPYKSQEQIDRWIAAFSRVGLPE